MALPSADHICVLYPDREEPIWCDTLEEAITYIVAENIGQGLPPFTYLENLNLVKEDDDSPAAS